MRKMKTGQPAVRQVDQKNTHSMKAGERTSVGSLGPDEVPKDMDGVSDSPSDGEDEEED